MLGAVPVDEGPQQGTAVRVGGDGSRGVVGDVRLGGEGLPRSFRRPASGRRSCRAQPARTTYVGWRGASERPVAEPKMGLVAMPLEGEEVSDSWYMTPMSPRPLIRWVSPVGGEISWRTEVSSRPRTLGAQCTGRPSRTGSHRCRRQCASSRTGRWRRVWIHQPNLGFSLPQLRNGVSDTSMTARSLSETQDFPPSVDRKRVSISAQRLLVETTRVPGRLASRARPPYPKLSAEPSEALPPGSHRCDVLPLTGRGVQLVDRTSALPVRACRVGVGEVEGPRAPSRTRPVDRHLGGLAGGLPGDRLPARSVLAAVEVGVPAVPPPRVEHPSRGGEEGDPLSGGRGRGRERGLLGPGGPPVRRLQQSVVPRTQPQRVICPRIDQQPFASAASVLVGAQLDVEVGALPGGPPVLRAQHRAVARPALGVRPEGEVDPVRGVRGRRRSPRRQEGSSRPSRGGR